MTTRRINPLPSPTWRWLRLNDASLALPAVLPGADCEVQVPADMRGGSEGAENVARGAEAAGFDAFGQVLTGAGPEVDGLLAASGTERRILALEGKQKEPARVRVSFDGDGAAAFGVTLAPESEAVLIMETGAGTENRGNGVVQTKVLAGRGASLTLVQVVRAGEGFTLINDVGALCEAGAAVKVVHLILGGGRIYQGCRADLEGDGSSLSADIGYQVRGTDLLDMNYVACHRGRRTESGIRAAGVLRDRASKLFRGTIDLQKGCAGAVGNEQEDVLIIDDAAVNRTIPLILCAEEDVVGNHGATIGRPDEDMMFYLASRGLSEEEIYALLSRARLDAVIRLIPDEETRRALQRELGAEEEPSEAGKEDEDA